MLVIAALQLRLNETLLVLKGKESISVLHPGFYAAYFVFCYRCYTTSCMLLFFPCILRGLREEMQWEMGARALPSGAPMHGVGASVQTAGRAHLFSGCSSSGADARSCLQPQRWPPAEELQLTWVENVLCSVEVSHVARCCRVQRPRSTSEGERWVRTTTNDEARPYSDRVYLQADAGARGFGPVCARSVFITTSLSFWPPARKIFERELKME